MKKKYLSIFIIAISCLISNCKDSSKGNDKNIPEASECEKISLKVGNQNKELIFSFESLEVSSSQRVWKSLNIVPKLKIGSIEDETFLFPGRIRIDGNENIYVLDFMDCSVKKFDSGGNFIKKFGKKGEGPGELTSPFDFDVLSDNKIVFLGVNDNKFIIFDNDIIREVKTKLMPNRICFVSPNEVVTFQILDPINQSPFQKTNFYEDKTSDYQNILRKESFGGKDFGILPFLLGDIHRYKLNKLVYVSSIMGYIVIFDETGKIENVFKLIDNIKESGIAKREIHDESFDLPIVAFPRKEEYLFESSNIFRDNLFVFSENSTNNSIENVIDVYSLTENKYKFSFLFKSPDRIIETFITNNKIYIAKENTEVVVYDYSIENYL